MSKTRCRGDYRPAQYDSTPDELWRLLCLVRKPEVASYLLVNVKALPLVPITDKDTGNEHNPSLDAHATLVLAYVDLRGKAPVCVSFG